MPWAFFYIYNRYMEIISSMANKKIKDYKKLLKKKYRREFKLFLVEGINLVEEAKSKAEVVDILTMNPEKEGIILAPFIYKRLTETESPQDIMAVVKMPAPKELGKRVLALDGVQDPGNVGTLIRTAVAFGFTDVIVKGADMYSAKTIRSSQGAIFKINLIQTNDITKFFDGKQVIGAMLDKAAVSYHEVKKSDDFILVLGNEGQGISEEVQKSLTDKVYIPIEFESLNVASAGAILINEYKKSS